MSCQRLKEQSSIDYHVLRSNLNAIKCTLEDLNLRCIVWVGERNGKGKGGVHQVRQNPNVIVTKVAFDL